MEVRTLRPGERGALLGLLDGTSAGAPPGEGWQLPDGWRAADFFRRSLLEDPRVADTDLWVAAEAGSLLACIQIFPRELWIGGVAVPCGGIGTVFTRADRRRQGIAELLLRRALQAMSESRLELSLLFAERIAWYQRLGWRSWQCTRSLLLRGSPEPGPSQTGFELSPFCAERDLRAVSELHRRFGRARAGCALRDEAAWQISLEQAGNPLEEFRVARAPDGGPLLAYIRAAVLEDTFTCLEFGHEERGVEALATLIQELMAPRSEDPLRRAGTPASGVLRSRMLSGPAQLDADLQRVLGTRGIRQQQVSDPSPMLRCLNADALARRVGVVMQPGEIPDAFLARLLPPDRFAFWPADRF